MKKPNLASASKRQLIEKSSSTVVLVLAAAAFIVAFSLVFMNFLWDLSGHNRRVIAEKSEAANTLEANVENIPDLYQNFTVFEAGEVKSDEVLDALPSKYDFPALATSIESLVVRSGLELTSFNGNDLEETAVQSMTQPSPIEMEFTVEVEGPYADVQKFIDNLEKTTRPIKINRMELQGTDTNMSCSIQAVTYYQPATSLEVETRTIE